MDGEEIQHNAKDIITLLELADIMEMDPDQEVAIRTNIEDFAPVNAEFRHHETGYAGSGYYAHAPAGAWRLWYRDWKRQVN